MSNFEYSLLPSELAHANMCVISGPIQQYGGSNTMQLRNDPQYRLFIYRNDIVKFNTSEDLLGIVQEVAGDSKSDSDTSEEEEEEEEDDDEDDEDSDDEDAGHEDGDAGDACGTGPAHEAVDLHYVEDEGDDEEQASSHGSDILMEGQVRVLWLDNSETTNNHSEITVIDRGFLHGDIVASVADPTGQIGIIMGANISVDLRAEDGSVIKDISSTDIRRIRDFVVGEYVVLGHWLGRVEEVVDNVTVLFDDGSCCKILKADPAKLKPLSKDTIADINCCYYPGQRVRARSSSVLKSSRWLSGTWKANRVEGTIVKVQQGSVYVYWVASALPGYGFESAVVPHEKQKPKDLTLLSCFSHANWQLGEWCLLPSQSGRFLSRPVGSYQFCMPKKSILKVTSNCLDKIQCTSRPVELEDENFRNGASAENSNILESSSCSKLSLVPGELVHGNVSVHYKKACKVLVKKEKKLRRRLDAHDKALQVVNTRTMVDVVWQDGTREYGRDGKSLIPIECPGEKDFCPEQFVVEKAADEKEHTARVQRIGVVKSVNAKDRTAVVRWLKPFPNQEERRELDCEEAMSVYELEEHPDYDYCYGDVVIRLSPVSAVEAPSFQNPAGEPESQQGSTEMNQKRKKRHKSPSQSRNEFSVMSHGLSWVGNISGLRDGDIEVTWADGTISKVGPQAIYVVGRDEDVVGNGLDTASWETFEGSEDTIEDKGQSIGSNMVVTSQMERCPSEAQNSGRGGPLSIPLAALGYVTRLASDLFLRGRNGLLSVSIINAKHASECKESMVEKQLADDELSYEGCHSPDDEERTTHQFRQGPGSMSGPRVSEQNAAGIMEVVSRECLTIFKHFDIAADPSDHYYHSLGAQGGREWAKKIQKEWSMIEMNIPNEIYLKIYEDRMDLLRAVIVGASGTPYHDGLFFFDFQLPPSYPQVPPLVYYRSYGLRINPNLYEDGKVCLSLLNTWSGKGNEIWNPSSSSILQVLVSLQGLVLNSRPYFNEAGYDKQVGTAEGEKNSLAYNENTFLLNCKTMLYSMQKAPKHFEEFVRQHFQKRSSYILRACDEYIKGRQVGSFNEEEHDKDERSGDINTVGFRLMLRKLLPRLVSALSDVGADCSHFKHLLSFP